MAIGATTGPGGWVRLYGDGYPGHIYVRLERDERGRYRIHDFILRGEWRPLYDGDLREMHLARIEDWVQDLGPMVDVFRAAPVPRIDDFFDAFGPPEKPRAEKPRVAPLSRPTDGLTDEFLRHVAAAHKQATEDGKAPAPELARQVGDGCSPRTIHKWVYVARERGIMPPAGRRRGA